MRRQTKSGFLGFSEGKGLFRLRKERTPLPQRPKDNAIATMEEEGRRKKKEEGERKERRRKK